MRFHVLKQEQWLIYTGLLGMLLAGICAVWVLINGAAVAPDGDVGKAFSFNAALGIFLLSTAMIMPYSGMSSRKKMVFTSVYIMLSLFSYFVETVQHFRGVNPRFPQGGGVFDLTMAAVFSVVAILLILFYLWAAVQYFKRSVYEANPELAIAIRYAMAAITLSFAAGIAIVMNQGREIGTGGNMIWLHGIGFHALQFMPLVSWLSVRKAADDRRLRHRMLHLSGISFLLGLAAMGWQTLLGLSIFEWAILPLTAVLCFLVALIPVALFMRRTYTSNTTYSG